jgi:hypothetical protein
MSDKSPGQEWFEQHQEAKIDLSGAFKTDLEFLEKRRREAEQAKKDPSEAIKNDLSINAAKHGAKEEAGKLLNVRHRNLMDADQKLPKGLSDRLACASRSGRRYALGAAKSL